MFVMFAIEEEVQNESADSVESTSSASEQAQSSTGEQSSSEQSGSVVVQVSRDELLALLQDSENRAASIAVDTVGSSLSGQLASMTSDIESLGTVAISDEQYTQLVQLEATQLHTNVVVVGLLSLLLGAVVATAVTLHWKARGA